MKFNNKVYDVLKWMCLIILPAIGTLYSVLANIWDWPCADQVVGTTSAISTCIGVAIGVSTAQHNKDEAVYELNNIHGKLDVLDIERTETELMSTDDKKKDNTGIIGFDY